MTANVYPTEIRPVAGTVADGAVIEIEFDGEPVTALVLLATDEFMVLDPCDGSTPVVVRYDEVGPFRVFEPELLGVAA